MKLDEFLSHEKTSIVFTEFSLGTGTVAWRLIMHEHTVLNRGQATYLRIHASFDTMAVLMPVHHSKFQTIDQMNRLCVV